MKTYTRDSGVWFNEDCLKVLKSLPENHVDLVVTSPPYDSIRDYDGYIFDFKAIAKQLFRVLKSGGILVWNVSDQVVNGGETGNSFRQALFFMDECGFKLHDTMIWHKTNFSNPSSTRYHQTFEYVFVFSKGKVKTFNPIKDRPNIAAGKIGSHGANTVTQKDGSKKLRKRKVNTAFGMRHNVWRSKTAGQDQTAKKYKHPAMFSEEFARDHIVSWSNPKDLVFDPFGGSGTTAAMAIRLKRRWVSCDLSKRYTRIALRRISKEEQK